MSAVIVCRGLAGVLLDGSNVPTPLYGSYLESYDPEFKDGLGQAQWTRRPDRAMRFDSGIKAFEFWRQQPKSRPLRDDGKPNRPLTAYTVEIGDLP